MSGVSAYHAPTGSSTELHGSGRRSQVQAVVEADGALTERTVSHARSVLLNYHMRRGRSMAQNVVGLSDNALACAQPSLSGENVMVVYNDLRDMIQRVSSYENGSRGQYEYAVQYLMQDEASEISVTNIRKRVDTVLNVLARIANQLSTFGDHESFQCVTDQVKREFRHIAHQAKLVFTFVVHYTNMVHGLSAQDLQSEPVFPPPLDPNLKLTPAQKLMIIILQQLSEYNMMKYRGACFQQRLVQFDAGSLGRRTTMICNSGAHEMVCTVEQFVYNQASRILAPEVWALASKHEGMVSTVGKMLQNFEDVQFPELERDATRWSCRNGIICIKPGEVAFTPYGSPEYREWLNSSHSKSTMKFIDCHFDTDLLECRTLHEMMLFVPAFNTICATQHITHPNPEKLDWDSLPTFEYGQNLVRELRRKTILLNEIETRLERQQTLLIQLQNDNKHSTEAQTTSILSRRRRNTRAGPLSESTSRNTDTWGVSDAPSAPDSHIDPASRGSASGFTPGSSNDERSMAIDAEEAVLTPRNNPGTNADSYGYAGVPTPPRSSRAGLSFAASSSAARPAEGSIGTGECPSLPSEEMTTYEVWATELGESFHGVDDDLQISGNPSSRDTDDAAMDEDDCPPSSGRLSVGNSSEHDSVGRLLPSTPARGDEMRAKEVIQNLKDRIHTLRKERKCLQAEYDSIQFFGSHPCATEAVAGITEARDRRGELRILCGMLGRSLFPLGEYDTLHLWLFLKGLTRTGKGTILKARQALEQAEDVAVLGDNAETKWSLAHIKDRRLCVAADIRHFAMDLGTFLSFVSLDPILFTEKYITAQSSERMTTPFLGAANVFPPELCESTGAVLERTVQIAFDVSPEEKKTNVTNDVVDKELANLLFIWASAYTEMRSVLQVQGAAGLASLMSPFMRAQQQNLRREIDPWFAFFKDRDWIIPAHPVEEANECVTAREAAALNPIYYEPKASVFKLFQEWFRAKRSQAPPQSLLTETAPDVAIQECGFRKSRREERPYPPIGHSADHLSDDVQTIVTEWIDHVAFVSRT